MLDRTTLMMISAWIATTAMTLVARWIAISVPSVRLTWRQRRRDGGAWQPDQPSIRNGRFEGLHLCAGRLGMARSGRADRPRRRRGPAARGARVGADERGLRGRRAGGGRTGRPGARGDGRARRRDRKSG